MIRTLADQATADVFVGLDSKPARRIPKSLWPVVRRKLDALQRARRLHDLRWPAGNRLEPLKGRRTGDWSLRVNAQYRITFTFEDGHAYQVACEDYH
ncbi:MAG: type II toxin-antitoxin system RelE/ParE family toxin [Vicinamibacterales bacterium]